jgi:amino acid transporter
MERFPGAEALLCPVIGAGEGAVLLPGIVQGWFDTLARQYVSWLRPIVDLLLINALLGATLAITNSFARVAFALGRDGAIRNGWARPTPGSAHRTLPWALSPS